jgi:hypothetical protein
MGRSPESPGRTLALADHRRYGPLRPGCDRIDRKRRPCAKIAALSLGIVLTLLQALPALAQIGTPGNAPLTPDGPRRGLGPPSITDHVPDIRLRSEGNGIPGAGPPIVPGAGSTGLPNAGGPNYVPRYGAYPRQRLRALGRACETPQRTCALATRAVVGASCACRLPNRSRARGYVVP